MSWEDIEDAMQIAVVAASNLPAGQVAWSYQNVDEPALDHMVITFGGEIMVGIDRIKTTTDLSRPIGQEVLQEIKGLREVPFELECFSAAVTGTTAARRTLELTRTKLRLPDIRGGLTAVGLSPFDPGPITYLPDIPSVKFRGRAHCTIRCYVPVMDCLEYTGYIARVVGTITAIGGGTTAGAASGISFAFDTLRASGASGFFPP